MVKTQASAHNNGSGQTKRLCVRNSSSDDSKLKLLTEQNQLSSNLSSLNMTASSNMEPQDSDSVIKSDIDFTVASTSNNNLSAKNATIEDNFNPRVINNEQNYIHIICNSDRIDESILIDSLSKLRDLITACNKRKKLVLYDTRFNDIVKLLNDAKLRSFAKAQVALLLCSVLKFEKENSTNFSETMIAENLLKLILEPEDEILLEASLRCLRSLLGWSESSSQITAYMYDLQHRSNKDDIASKDTLSSMLSHAMETNSQTIQECIADIFSMSEIDRNISYETNALRCIKKLMTSVSDRVTISSLKWLAQICYKNRLASLKATEPMAPNNSSMLSDLIPLMHKCKHIEIQFAAARCYAYIYKACCLNEAICTIISQNVVPALVRMIQKERPPQMRIKAAECIGYFIEDSPELQMVASSNSRLIEALRDMLECDEEPPILEPNDLVYSKDRFYSAGDGQDISNVEPIPDDIVPPSPLANCKPKRDFTIDYSYRRENYDEKMTQVALKSLSSLCSANEDIRKKVTDTFCVLRHLVYRLSSNEEGIKRAALSCLLSLSRSVFLLRTDFAEINVHAPIKKMLEGESDEILQLVLSVLCNLTLDFSSVKCHFVDEKTITTICKITKSPNPVLRLHAIWVLMNTAFEAGERLKLALLQTLGMDQLFNLLAEKEEAILLKTLGFLRNVLSEERHIDTVMDKYGNRIMQEIEMIIDYPRTGRTAAVREQAMCIFDNIASGGSAKNFIMARSDLLEKILNYIGSGPSELELVAIHMVTNLVHKNDRGYLERRAVLKQYNVVEKLKARLNGPEQNLADLAKTAYNSFNEVNIKIEK